MEIGTIYHWSSILCYIFSALAFALTVFLFFHYKILDAFNVLSGRKLKKDLERLEHLRGAADGETEELGGLSETAPWKDTRTQASSTSVISGGARGSRGANVRETAPLRKEAEGKKVRGTAPLRDTPSRAQETAPLTRADDTDSLDVVITGASDTELL